LPVNAQKSMARCLSSVSLGRKSRRFLSRSKLDPVHLFAKSELHFLTTDPKSSGFLRPFAEGRMCHLGCQAGPKFVSDLFSLEIIVLGGPVYR